MSRENVEVVRKSFDAWKRGDDMRAFVSENYAPDATMYPLTDFADSQIRHGREEILRLLIDLREPLERNEIDVEEVVDAGDYVATAIVWRAVLRGTEDEVEMRVGMTFALREGKITEVHFFRTFADALEAGGLRE